jgi:hypothetical protein
VFAELSGYQPVRGFNLSLPFGGGKNVAGGDFDIAATATSHYRIRCQRFQVSAGFLAAVVARHYQAGVKVLVEVQIKSHLLHGRYLIEDLPEMCHRG